ncbi:MAG: hypothetical protein WC762_06790 [Methylobacter sp.]|jgi:hypothetical protein
MLAPTIHGNISTILIPALIVADIPLYIETIMAEHTVIMIMAMAGIKEIFRIAIMTNTTPRPLGTRTTQAPAINMTTEVIMIGVAVTLTSTWKTKTIINMTIMMATITAVKITINALTINKPKLLFGVIQTLDGYTGN